VRLDTDDIVGFRKLQSIRQQVDYYLLSPHQVNLGNYFLLKRLKLNYNLLKLGLTLK